MFEESYRIDHPSKRRHKLIAHGKWFMVGLVAGTPVLLVVLLLTTSVFTRQENLAPISEVQTSIQSPSVEIFRTAYFQFQANKTWLADAKETTVNKFVYRSFRGPLIEHELNIYVNPSIQSIDVSYVQPVRPKPDGGFEVVGGISQHCRSALPDEEKKQIRTVTLNDTTFTCRGDGSNFDVVISQIGGSPYIELWRPDNTHARYLIVYKDLTAGGDGRELGGIIKSFQTR